MRLLTIVELRHVVNHRWPHRLVIIIKGIASCRLPFDLRGMLWDLTWLERLLMHRSLREVGHCRSLGVLELLLVNCPVVGCLLELGYSLLKCLLVCS